MKNPDRPAGAPHELVCLFDVDNTLLDNDSVKRRLGELLDQTVHAGASDAYWKHYEELRAERGHSDFLGTFQRAWEASGRDPRWLPAARLLLEYPFADNVYPRVTELLEKLAGRGPVGILSDGDAVLQPRKIRRSGLWDRVAGNVLIYQHKENELDDVAARLPARRYLLVDDKVRLLDAVKKIWGERVTTVFVRQGHYAFDPEHTEGYAADHTIDAIGELVDLDLDALLADSAAG